MIFLKKGVIHLIATINFFTISYHFEATMASEPNRWNKKSFNPIEMQGLLAFKD